jgi:hypothetical protein
MYAQIVVEISGIARHLFLYEIWDFHTLINGGKFNFCHHQALIVTKELIDLKGVIAAFYQPTYFIDDARFAKAHELRTLFQ